MILALRSFYLPSFFYDCGLVLPRETAPRTVSVKPSTYCPPTKGPVRGRKARDICE